MIKLENEFLIAEFAEKGAELQHLIAKDSKIDYMWKGDPNFWGKHSPILFPIVGGLKDNVYHYQGTQYSLSRHGFARDRIFEVVAQDATSVTFELQSDEATKKVYPFDFQLYVIYTLESRRLLISYKVQNKTDGEMYFSIGAHPAFTVPLDSKLKFDDYTLQFSTKEASGIYPLDEQGQILEKSIPFLENTDLLPLKKSLFYKDALVFKDLKSTSIRLQSEKSPHGLEVHFDGFPYMGIWNATDADFVCIEPWLGIADNVATNGDLTEKEGILHLDKGAHFQAEWSINIY